MTTVLTLPRLGETMEEGRVVAWNVAPGDAFRRGDVLLEVETDKTVVEVPALADGVLAEIVAGDGVTVRVGDPIARLAGAGVTPTAAPDPVAAPDPEPMPAAAAPAPVPQPSGDRVRATPVARRLARQAGLDPAAIPGTGRRGRVERGDVEQARAARDGAAGLIQARGLAYRLTGPAGGGPVALLHGFGADHGIWSGLAAGLARAGRRVLAVDLPGHGAARADAATPAALSAGLVPLLAETLGAPAHVVAHSLGAVPAVDLAEAGAAASLTLIAPAGLGLAIDRAVIAGLAGARAPGEVAHLLGRMAETPLPLSPAALSAIATALARGRLRALADTVAGDSGQAVCLRARLAPLADRLPVRIVAAQRDRILDWRDMVTVSPRIAVHHLPRAGHAPFWDAPQDVLAVVLSATAG